MVMSQAAVVKMVRDTLYPQFKRQKDSLDAIDNALRGVEPDHNLIPARATLEHRALRDLTHTPLLQIVVTTVAQTLFADGYKSPDSGEDARGWDTWQANDFDRRQSQIHRAALSYGLAFATVLPGVDANGPRSVMRGVSPRRMVALYQDSAEDDWPMYAMRVEASGDKLMCRVYDEKAVYFVSMGAGGDDIQFIEWREHGAGVCPVVRYTNLLDLDGRADGEVAPLIPIASRHRKTVYDRMLAQHFNSWKVRTATGLERPEDDAEAQAEKLRLQQEDILVSDSVDTKFGTLDETPLKPFLDAMQSDLDELSAVAQVPSTALSGTVANLSADAIAELRAGLTQKTAERKMSFGSSHAQAIRLALQLEGDQSAAADYTARMTWQDMSPRTMAQTVNALSVAAEKLQIPPQKLWHMIPGLTKSDVDEWIDDAAKATRRAALQERLATAATTAAVQNSTVAGLSQQR